MISTKIYNNWQLNIPSELRKKHNIKKDDNIIWDSLDDDKIVLTIKRKKDPYDLVGLVSDGSMDAVEAKKKAAKGEKY